MMFSCFGLIAASQDTLPDVSVQLLGNKAVVSWKNPYDNITSISIQRSGDSLRNFKSIGSVFNAGAATNGFVDHKEFLPNEQYYRLFVTFEGGEYLFTPSHQPVLDTTGAAPPIAEIVEVVDEAAERDARLARNIFVPSGRVYTGLDHNVIISLADARQKKYTIKFYDDYGAFLFELKKIPENYLILDKANFSHSGLFRFELYEDGTLKEAHKVYIPKPGRPMPLLDVNGYEIRKK